MGKIKVLYENTAVGGNGGAGATPVYPVTSGKAVFLNTGVDGAISNSKEVETILIQIASKLKTIGKIVDEQLAPLDWFNTDEGEEGTGEPEG